MKQLLINNKSKLIKLAIFIVLVLAIVLYIVVQIIGRRTVYVPRDPYDKTGFIEVNDIEKETYTLSNSRFDFKLNVDKTTFEVTDKQTNQVWRSTATKVAENLPIVTEELFIIYYESQLETPRPYEVNRYSINEKRYMIRENDDNSIEVLYMVGGKLRNVFEDLPRRIDKEKFERLILEPLNTKVEDGVVTSRDLRILLQQFQEQADPEGDYYFLRTLQAQDAIDLVYRLIFEESDYTFDDYITDNSQYGFPTIKDLPYFEFSIKYALTNKGLSVTLVNDSIVELEKFPIAYIDVLPYFGSNNINDDGMTVIPDGSGIVINHDNNKYNTIDYEKRIYGSDAAIGNRGTVMPEQQEVVKFPMYGYSKNDTSFINVIETGAPMATIRAGFRTTGSYTNKIPYVYYRYALRERDAHLFQSSSLTQNVYSWTKEYNTEDLKMQYIFIDSNTYFDMAKAYQEYLVDTYNLQPKHNENQVKLTFLGGYQEREYFLGIPYYSTKTLTTTSQILEVVNRLKTQGVENLSVHYDGWSNGGIRQENTLKVKFDSDIAKAKDIKKLNEELAKINVDFYLDYLVQNTYTDKGISVKNDVLHTILQKPAVRNTYNEALMLAENDPKQRFYKLDINAETKAFNSYLKALNKVNVTTASFKDLGNEIGSQFKVNETTFRYQVAQNQSDKLSGLSNVSLRSPNLYALLHADEVLDIPMNGTMHKMVDYDIPFVQLVLNGYFAYSGQSVNMYQGSSKDWHLLYALETASQLQYTLSYLSTVVLVDTTYSKYYATYFDNYMDTIVEYYNILNGLGIYEAVIINHEVLNDQATRVATTYSNGIKVTIDYANNSYEVSEVNVWFLR